MEIRMRERERNEEEEYKRAGTAEGRGEGCVSQVNGSVESERALTLPLVSLYQVL